MVVLSFVKLVVCSGLELEIEERVDGDGLKKEHGTDGVMILEVVRVMVVTIPIVESVMEALIVAVSGSACGLMIGELYVKGDKLQWHC